jgi:asparagine synthase (glutamine-hydrolysing)
VKRLLYGAVEKRLQSDVPVAVLLSAGIDSSAIACIAREFKDEVNVISAGYSGKYDVDERYEAKRLSDEKLFNWNELELDDCDFEQNLIEILQHLDEPNGDVAMFAQWEIFKEAKIKGYKVVLSGNGGDELFYGYSVHNNYAMGLQWLKSMKSLFPMSNKSDLQKLLVKYLLRTFFKNKSYIFDKLELRMDFPVQKEVDQLARQITPPLYRSDWHRVGSYSNELDNVYYYLHYAWLTNNCYFLADKLAMAHSVEVRSPFADLDLINFIDTLPLEIKFKNATPKQLLKDSLKGTLPNYVLNRRKTGFTPPRIFVDNLVNNYKNAFFKSAASNFPQLVTDYFASNI